MSHKHLKHLEMEEKYIFRRNVDLNKNIQLTHTSCSPSISPEVWLRHLANPLSLPLWIWGCTSHQEVQAITYLSVVSEIFTTLTLFLHQNTFPLFTKISLMT